ncbi:MAG: 3-oxoacid CoA-transferase subunit A [Pikeienuella sp.]
MTKPVLSLAEAVAPITDGATVMISGFGGSGAPIELVHALIDHGAKGLTVINNNAGTGQIGLAALIRERRVEKMICSYPRTSDARNFTELYLAGKIDLELSPQGVLAERIRAAGAGMPAFFTRTAAGTDLAKGKEQREIDGVLYVMETWLKADFALVKADRADLAGNLTYRLSARNFGPIMCMAATTSIVQAREILPKGGIDPDMVITPGIFVDSIVHAPEPQQEEILIREGARYP